MIDHLEPDDADRPATIEQDEMTIRLLRLAVTRGEIPADRAARVRAAVLGECRTVARVRHVRRRVLIGAAALSAAAALVIGLRQWAPFPASPPAGPRIASIETWHGTGARRRDASGSPSPMQAGLAIREGDFIQTDPLSRVAMRLAEGASLRVDRTTTVRLVSAKILELSAGAVYVDSGPASSGLEVRTPLATVRDIGTQFEVRVIGGALRVRVRSGIVDVYRGREVTSARPGAELTVDGSGVTSGSIAAHAPDWAWAARLAPAFVIEGRPLDVFLERWCREEGWTLAYGDPGLAREASGMILHGSIEGLQPIEALRVVLATTGLTHRVEDGHLVVARSARP